LTSAGLEPSIDYFEANQVSLGVAPLVSYSNFTGINSTSGATVKYQALGPQGHADNFYGLSVLLGRFPNARATATPKSVDEMHKFLVPPLDQIMQRCRPGQLATKLVAAEP
jgi:hypothetical protein